MLDDAVVLLAMALNGDLDASYSVNALLPAVSRRAGDAAPPLIAAVYDQVRTKAIIQGEEPDAVPALVVTANADLSLYTLGGERTPASIGVARPQPGLAGSPLILSVSYVIRLTDAVPAAPNTGYSLTAIRRSIGRFFAADEATRTLNDTLLLGTTQITERRLLASKGNSALMGVVLAVCLVEDLAP
jgi:hypothetical protein